MWRFDLQTREQIISANILYVRLLRLATFGRGGTLVGHAYLGFLLMWDRSSVSDEYELAAPFATVESIRSVIFIISAWGPSLALHKCWCH